MTNKPYPTNELRPLAKRYELDNIPPTSTVAQPSTESVPSVTRRTFVRRWMFGTPRNIFLRSLDKNPTKGASVNNPSPKRELEGKELATAKGDTRTRKKQRVGESSQKLLSDNENVQNESTVWDDWEKVIDLYLKGGALTSHVAYKDLTIDEKRRMDLPTSARSCLETIGNTCLELGRDRFNETIGYSIMDSAKRKRSGREVFTRCRCVSDMLRDGAVFPLSFLASSCVIDKEVEKRRKQVSETERVLSGLQRHFEHLVGKDGIRLADRTRSKPSN